MKQTKQLTAIIQRERDGYVSLCPELDIASQGSTIEEARDNLVEALEIFFETADPSEIQERLHTEVFITSVRPFRRGHLPHKPPNQQWKVEMGSQN